MRAANLGAGLRLCGGDCPWKNRMVLTLTSEQTKLVLYGAATIVLLILAWTFVD